VEARLDRAYRNRPGTLHVAQKTCIVAYPGLFKWLEFRASLMPLSTWKVLLRRSEQVGYHYVTTLHRAFEPTVGERIPLLVDGQTVLGTAIDVRKEFSTRAGVAAFTVMVDEAKADPV
jgi:hypothetical protein